MLLDPHRNMLKGHYDVASVCNAILCIWKGQQNFFVQCTKQLSIKSCESTKLPNKHERMLFYDLNWVTF